MTHARQQLQQVPGLLHRMANLMGVEFHGELPSTEAVDLVLEEMWKFNQTYQLAHGVSGQPGLRRPVLSGLVGGSPLTPQVSRLPFPWPVGAALGPCDFVTGLLLLALGQPVPEIQVSAWPRTQPCPRPLDVGPATWLSLSQCLQVPALS